MALTQIHSGVTSVGQIIKFPIEDTGILIVSNQNLDTTVYSSSLMVLRRDASASDADYVAMTPTLLLNNDNNYQILSTGSYALKFSTSTNVIISVMS